MRATIDKTTAELWRYRLDRVVGGSGVSTVDVVVVEIETGDGLTGTGFSYVLSGSGEVSLLAARHMLKMFVAGEPVGHPEPLWRRIDRALNRTGRGAAYIALAAVDLALWDLYAKSLDIPVGRAMGGTPRSVKVYGSGGFTAEQSADEAAETAKAYLARGVSAVKLRVAGRPGDRNLVRGVADAIGSSAFQILDANEKCTRSSGAWLRNLGREFGVLFLEEPFPARDLDAYLASAGDGAPVLAAGEHLQGLTEVMPLMAGRCVAIVQPDLAMMGGLTECLRIARVAEAFGAEIAPHFLPGVFVHLAAAAPNVTWLEDFPLLEPLLSGLPSFDQTGRMEMSEQPGLGFSLDAAARSTFRVAI